jgi:hypothetical protein
MAYQSTDSVDVLEGGVFGVGAYVVGVLVTLIATVARSTPAPMNAPIRETSAGAATVVDYGGFSGYLFAHLWIHELSVLTEFTLATYLLPFTVVLAAVLVTAGFAVASLAGGYRTEGGFRHGASITIGYFPVAVLATLLVGVTIDDVTLLGLDSVLTLFVAGLGYPVVFGGLGGFLSKRL